LSLRRAPVTALLLVAIGIMFLLETLAGGSTNSQVLYALGANHPDGVLRDGEWWRLVSSMFLHIGIAHVLLNGWALYQLGGLFEMAVGSSRMLLVWFVSGVAGSLASLWWTQGLSAGASGAIFGLLGALIAYLLRRREHLTPFAKSLLGQLVAWAAINVFIGFSIPGIDNAAHLGGCAAGFLLGLVLPGRQAEARRAEVPI
jgi:rhomboid protease GluP